MFQATENRPVASGGVPRRQRRRTTSTPLPIVARRPRNIHQADECPCCGSALCALCHRPLAIPFAETHFGPTHRSCVLHMALESHEAREEVAAW